jgi:hypothetical protein
MKRPSMSIAGRPVSKGELRAAVSAASAAWLKSQRGAKPKADKRKHRALTKEERETKAQATAQAKMQRKAEREARELERLLARIGYLSRRSAREAEAMLRVRVNWKRSAEPKVRSVCPRSLYSRLHPEISARTVKAMTRSRIAGDGFKNIVLRKILRGYGRKGAGTREYRGGEAADLVRYMLREAGLEEGIVNSFSNIIETEGEHALYETETFSVDDRRCAQIVGFWNALEAFEAEADGDGNVYSHLILAMPHELSPEGRSRALEDFCFRLDAIHLPFVAALHRPDPEGDVRNFHAHIIVAPRPFAVEGPFAWSFEAGKATEFNLPAGIGWLREQAAQAFNHALGRENNPLRYSGLSQARRGVPATGETHDGPAATARKRKAEKDLEERERLAGGLAAHVGRAAKRQTELGAMIDSVASRKQPVHAAAPAPQVPSALAELRGRFPDPLKLRGLSALDFMSFTAADRAADDWYGPAFNLAAELRRASTDFVRDRDGQPDLVEERLKPEYRSLLHAPALPDIVEQAVAEAHRRVVREQDREARITREKKRIRKDRMRWLRGTPVLLFDERLRVLPQYRELFPPEVIELDGIRDAMFECHIAATVEQKRLLPKETEASHKLPEPDHSTAAEKQPPETASEISTQVPQQPPVQGQENDDDAWDRLLQGAHTGKGGAGR